MRRYYLLVIVAVIALQPAFAMLDVLNEISAERNQAASILHVQLENGDRFYADLYDFRDESVILRRWSLTADGPWQNTEVTLLLSDIVKIETDVLPESQSNGTHSGMHSGWFWGTVMGLAMVAMMIGGVF